MWPGLASLAPTTYTKTCPAYATPFVPTVLKTTSPERLLRPPPSLPPCFKFFLPLQPLLRRPWASLCICGRDSLRSPQPHIQKLTLLILPPSHPPTDAALSFPPKHPFESSPSNPPLKSAFRNAFWGPSSLLPQAFPQNAFLKSLPAPPLL